MRHLRSEWVVGLALTTVMLAACGTTQNIAVRSQSAGTPTVMATAGVSPSPTAATSPSPAPADLRLVIVDYGLTEVRLARLDATDTARVKGVFDGIVADQVIVVNGTALEALNRNGTVTKLGQLVGVPEMLGAGSVAVNPELSQWLYAIRDDASTARIHLGTPTADTVIATLPSPDGNAFYRPFAWNASGVYMVRQPVGIGGAGPFLEYDFPLAKFDLTTGRVTDVSPQCIVHQVLDDGTMICGQPNVGGRIDVRSPTGQSNVIQVGTGVNTDDNFIRVAVSPDGKRLVAGRNGAKDPVINYQMAVADLTASSAGAFGPLDYLPDAWLPDGRLIAHHSCVYSEWGGGPCNAGLDGTYFFSADGSTHSLFYKLTGSADVVGYV